MSVSIARLGECTVKESRYNIWVEHKNAVYVFNGISGALLRVPKDDYHSLRKFLSDGGKSNCSPKLLEQMAYGYMLIPDNFDELSSLSSLYNASRWDTSTFGLTIVTSLGCNFDCPYCFEAKHPSVMDDNIQRAVLNVLDDQISNGIKGFYVTWFGGEPLVGKKSLLSLSDAFIEHCQRRHIDYTASIVTNGYLLDEKTCAELRDRKVKTHSDKFGRATGSA